jgi:hypothetical protein
MNGEDLDVSGRNLVITVLSWYSSGKTEGNRDGPLGILNEQFQAASLERYSCAKPLSKSILSIGHDTVISLRFLQIHHSKPSRIMKRQFL